MAHFAKLDDNNIVLEVHVVNNDALDSLNEEESGIAFLTNWSGGYSKWKQTSYNNNFRKKYAAVGDFYDAENDVFISPKPFPSWNLDENWDWIAPIARPTDGKMWLWNENKLAWVRG